MIITILILIHLVIAITDYTIYNILHERNEDAKRIMRAAMTDRHRKGCAMFIALIPVYNILLLYMCIKDLKKFSPKK